MTQPAPIPVFVVSLARAAERRRAICAHLHALAIDYILTDAVDGAALPAEELARCVAPGATVAPGAVGCALSHIAIWRRMVQEGMKLALVLEDDAVLDPAFVAVLRAGIDWTGFDYCFLDCDSRNEDGPVFYDRASAVRIGHGFTAYRAHAGPATTHAYLITLAAAERRLACALPISRPIDIYAGLPWTPRFYAMLHPKAAGVAAESFRSYISGRHHDARDVGFRALRRHAWFYTLRNGLSAEQWRSRLAAGRLRRAGVLPRDGRWRPLPLGRPLRCEG